MYGDFLRASKDRESGKVLLQYHLWCLHHFWGYKRLSKVQCHSVSAPAKFTSSNHGWLWSNNHRQPWSARVNHGFGIFVKWHFLAFLLNVNHGDIIHYHGKPLVDHSKQTMVYHWLCFRITFSQISCLLSHTWMKRKRGNKVFEHTIVWTGCDVMMMTWNRKWCHANVLLWSCDLTMVETHSELLSQFRESDLGCM